MAISYIVVIFHTHTLHTADKASKSRESEFCSVSSINYAAAMDRRASSAAVANSKLCFFVTSLKKNCQWPELEYKTEKEEY